MIKKEEPRCKGLKAEGAFVYSLYGINLFNQLIAQVRQEFLDDIRLKRVDHYGEIAIGGKFTANDMVLWMLTSNIPEADFKENPLTWIYDALHACALSDYWYLNEKKY